jgi:oxygen-independent coproporphyrinogen-3 oxidase
MPVQVTSSSPPLEAVPFVRREAQMPDELIRRLSRPVPRYTSYPTAPHFHEGINSATYARWVRELPHDVPLSLYLHIPFCDRLCWFCGCHTKQVLRYEPIAAYLVPLVAEIRKVAELLDGRGRVTAIHLGGGSPSMLKPADLLGLAATLQSAFAIEGQPEFSIEIDPNDMTPDRYAGFAAAGVNRASIGVQDFDPKVQAAINRIQTPEQTRAVVDGMRAAGVTSVNLDVLYGLPFQTLDSLQRTIGEVLSMRPDRIALFGYAHVPWMKTHQKMIDESALPDVVARYRQAEAAAAQLIAAGYVAVGMDHFALPSDGLAIAAQSGALHRNFQGYTTDDATALIGLGASAIGVLPQGYVQNVTATGQYMRQVSEGGLALVRGVALTPDDRLRRYVIEQLMCNFEVSLGDLRSRFGPLADALVGEIAAFCAHDKEQLASFDGRRLVIAPARRAFVRLVAAAFDTYLVQGERRHSLAV